jgi:hypothetical protein
MGDECGSHDEHPFSGAATNSKFVRPKTHIERDPKRDAFPNDGIRLTLREAIQSEVASSYQARGNLLF